MAVPAWQRWPPLLLSQTISPPCPAHAHCHPLRRVPSPLSVSGLLSPGWRNWLSGVEPCICGEVVWSPWCRSLCTLHCTGQYQKHGTNNMVKFVSESFVPGAKQFLSQSVAGSEVVENSSEFLWHPLPHMEWQRSDDRSSPLPVLSGSCSWSP